MALDNSNKLMDLVIMETSSMVLGRVLASSTSSINHTSQKEILRMTSQACKPIKSCSPSFLLKWRRKSLRQRGRKTPKLAKKINPSLRQRSKSMAHRRSTSNVSLILSQKSSHSTSRSSTKALNTRILTHRRKMKKIKRRSQSRVLLLLKNLRSA